MLKTSRIIIMAGLAASASLLAGCYSFHRQDVTVSTGKVLGATCKLRNNRGVWHIKGTPATVSILPSSRDLIVTCHTSFHKPTTAWVQAHDKMDKYDSHIGMHSGFGYGYPKKVFVHFPNVGTYHPIVHRKK